MWHCDLHNTSGDEEPCWSCQNEITRLRAELSAANEELAWRQHKGIDQTGAAYLTARMQAEAELCAEILRHQDTLHMIAELQRWKGEMLVVLKQLNLQEIGKHLNLTVGEEISPAILPGILARDVEIKWLRAVMESCITCRGDCADITDGKRRCWVIDGRCSSGLGPTIDTCENYKLRTALKGKL